jgi:N,N'-diacetyllegionaminate synthase
MKLIAETAWHHEGDFKFMKDLITDIATKTNVDIIKMHISLDLDEYMSPNHELYEKLKSMMLNQQQWTTLVKIIRDNNKEVMLLVNDTKAINFSLLMKAEFVEIHSVCLNDIILLKHLKNKITKETKIVLGIGGSSIEEIENAIEILDNQNIILMSGFQNYPTKLEDINLNKIRKLINKFNHYEHGYADHTIYNHEYNQFITLMGAASGMQYIEKHVTNQYGSERIDSSAAISIDMLNELNNHLEVLKKINGSGSLSMNSGELSYSVFGPMKKTAITICDISNGETLKLDYIKFIRTNEVSDMSQIDILNSIGKKIKHDIKNGTVLKSKYFI